MDSADLYQDLRLKNYSYYWNVSHLTTPELWLQANETFFENFTTHLNMRHLVLLVMCLFILTLVLVIVLVLRLRRVYLRWKRRKSQPSISIINGNGASPQQKRGILGRMIARIDEFDSLTPLIITPGSISEEPADPQPRQELVRLANLGSGGPGSSVSASPPPLRRGPPGKITLVPLSTNLSSRNRPTTLNSVGSLGLQDYTGAEIMTLSTTTRSVGTIPEVEVYDNETGTSNNSKGNENGGSGGTLPQSASGHSLTFKKTGAPYTELDLISIDRTSVSTLEKVVPYRERPRPSSVPYANSNGSRPCSIPPPNYRPPAPPNYSTNGGNGTSEFLTSSSSNDSLKLRQKAIGKHANNGGNMNLTAISPSYVSAVYKQCLRFDPSRAPSQNGSAGSQTRFPKGITHKLDEEFVKHQVSEFSMEWNPNVELLSACGCALSAQPHALNSSTFGFHSIKNSDTSCLTNSSSNLCVIPKESPSIDSLSSNLSSPLESSVGESGSPLDTTGSIADLSDSFYLASESDTTTDARSLGKNYYPESGTVLPRLGTSAAYSNSALSSSDKSETDVSSGFETAEIHPPKRYQLHRIEEESEAEDLFGPIPKSKTADSLGSALSREMGSVLDSESNLLVQGRNPAGSLQRKHEKKKEGLI